MRSPSVAASPVPTSVVLAVSFTPAFRVRWPQVDRSYVLRAGGHCLGADRADVLRGHSMRSIRAVGDVDAARLQLITKSYRPRSHRQGRFGKLGHALHELVRSSDKWVPGGLSGGFEERREDLAAPCIEDRKQRAAIGLGSAARQRRK